MNSAPERPDRPDSRKPSQGRDEATVKLMQRFFRDMCEADQVPMEKRAQVTALYFCGWTLERMQMTSVDDKLKICADLQIEPAIWDFAQGMMESGAAPEKLHPVWYSITLCDQPRPTKKLSRLQTLVVLAYEDGTICPLHGMLNKSMMQPGMEFDDGFLLSIMQQQFASFMGSVVNQGIDGLHTAGSDFRGISPEDPYEVMMGFVKRGIMQIKNPELAQKVEAYFRLVQGILRPVVPLDLVKKIQRHTGQPAPAAKEGGWSE